jgi:tetratricopeptide (TPR) repeat protein
MTVFAGGAIAMLLVALVASTAIQKSRIQAQRDRAEQAAGFLTELFEDLEPAQAPGNTVVPREILDRAAERVTTEMSGAPLLQAQLFDVLGRVYQMRGFFVEAEPLLRRALSLRSDALGTGHIDVANSRYNLAMLMAETDRHGEAAPLLTSAAATLRQQLGPDHPRVASIEIEQALALRAAGNLMEADSILGDAVAILRRHPDELADLATALLYLGKVRVEQGDTDSGEPAIREALDIRRGLFGDKHPTVANALDGIGELMQARGDYAGAENAYRKALATRRTLFPADHADVGVSLENLGIVLQKQGQGAEAVALLDSALSVLLPALGHDHRLVRVAVAYKDSALN